MTTLILILLVCVTQMVTVGIVCYFMHKNTIGIAAFKRASAPWEVRQLYQALESPEKENENAQQESGEFETIPGDIDADALRSQL